MDKLVIDRLTWYRGHGSDDSYLLNPKGQMCCLGFLAKKLGYTDEEICGFTQPSTCEDTSKWTGLFAVKDGFESPLVSSLISVNDNTHLTEIDRDDLISKLFKIANIEVEFIN